MTTLLREESGGIAVLTLHRPDQLNALDYALIDALGATLEEIEADSTVRSVILTGSGDKAFSAGADIGEFAGSIGGGVESALREFVRRGQRLTRQIESYPKPLIVAVNGIAFGAGCEITEAAPLALASCTQAEPSPPAAPVTAHTSPSDTSPRRITACQPVWAGMR